MNEKFINPFKMQYVKDEEIEQEITLLIKNLNLIENLDRLTFLTKNIQIYADLMILIGECIARKKLSYEALKANIKISEAKYMYKCRKDFKQTSNEKAPAMSYFEALALEFVKDDVIKLAKLSEELTRFKNAYDSYEHKINALKKDLEIAKYQESVGVYG